MNACPENLGNWSSSPQNELELSPRSIQSCFLLLEGPSYRKSLSAHFRSNWVKYDYNPRSHRQNVFLSIRWTIVIVFDPVRSKMCWRWFPATGPVEKRETALFSDPMDDLWPYLTQLDRKSVDGDFLQLGPLRSGKHLVFLIRWTIVIGSWPS